MNSKRFSAALVLAYLTSFASAQQSSGHSIAIDLRYSATRAQTLSGGCCFYLGGGAADAALPMLPHVSAVVEVAGQTTSQVAGTTRGLSTLTLLAGPRYTQPVGSRFQIAAQALFGAARGFDADFSTATSTRDTATAFAYAAGGFAEYRVSRAVQVRLVQADYLQTNLPNGVDNRQRNIRLGAGVTFTVPLPQSRR